MSTIATPMGSKENDLQVIGTGLPRTGTLSLLTALEMLGFGPCYHYKSVVLDGFPYRDSRLWRQACKTANGEVRRETVKQIYGRGGYKSAVDYPTSLFVEDLVRLYPNAKFIHGVRSSPEQWRRSFQNTVARYNSPLVFYSTLLVPSQLLSLLPLASSLKALSQRLHGVDVSEPADGLEIYHRHNEHVYKVVPRDQLLEFNPKDGWEPLCEFLNVPIPVNELGERVEFPQVNITEQLRDGTRRLMYKGWACWAALIFATYLGVAHSRSPVVSWIRQALS